MNDGGDDGTNGYGDGGGDDGTSGYGDGGDGATSDYGDDGDDTAPASRPRPSLPARAWRLKFPLPTTVPEFPPMSSIMFSNPFFEGNMRLPSRSMEPA